MSYILTCVFAAHNICSSFLEVFKGICFFPDYFFRSREFWIFICYAFIFLASSKGHLCLAFCWLCFLLLFNIYLFLIHFYSLFFIDIGLAFLLCTVLWPRVSFPDFSINYYIF